MNYHKQDLDGLIDNVIFELRNALYSELTITTFSTVWNRLVHYMKDRCETIYTAKVGMNFLEFEYGITVFKNLSKKDMRCARAINLLTDYVLHGIIFSRTRKTVYSYHPFQTIFQTYIDNKREDGFSEDTLSAYKIYLSRFADYLNKCHIVNIHDLKDVHVLGFTDTFTRFSPSVIHNTLCSIRTFLHYLFHNGFVDKDFAYIVPHDGYRTRTKVPSAYSKENIDTLIKSIDRGNPKGKRDYAIILIAARLGLRAQDICNLSFDNLKWETNTIQFLQEKTDVPITLPLLEDVGLAIIDYLKYGRPECQFTNAIFLRLTPPIGKLEAPTLHSIVTQHMHIAGIKINDGKKHGPHALRHSLASALLEENTPLPIISEVLGHKSISSTSAYLSIDINQLRTCSLEPLPFDWKKGAEVF